MKSNSRIWTPPARAMSSIRGMAVNLTAPVSSASRWSENAPGHDGIRARGANRIHDLEGQRCYRHLPAPVRPVRHPHIGFSMQPPAWRESTRDLLDSIVLLLGGNCPKDAGDAIGESDSRDVVASMLFKSECPGSERIRLRLFLRMPEDGAGTVDEEHADVLVAPLRDRPEVAGQAARLLAWSQAEIAGEVPAGGEPIQGSHEGFDGRGRQNANAGNGSELSHLRHGYGEGLELSFGRTDPILDLPDLVASQREDWPEGRWILESGSRIVSRTRGNTR